MTSNEKEYVNAHQCQTQVDKNLAMGASTKLPVMNGVYTTLYMPDLCCIYFAER